MESKEEKQEREENGLISESEDFKELEKNNKILRDNIDKNLKLYMTEINDEYQDIVCWINLLIDNEIEQEKLCNQ